MTKVFLLLPASFWVVVAILIVGAAWAREKIRAGIGIPMLAVLGTVTAWYVLDLLYNGYQEFVETFTSNTIANAWWEVALFLGCFLTFAPFVHRTFNIRYLHQSSSICHMAREGVNDPSLQLRLASVLRASLLVWAALAIAAAFRLGAEIPFYFFPFLDHKADPWLRGRVGSGLDAGLSLASYLQVFVSACFGVAAALLKNKPLRRVAICACALAWPYFIFDRTRNVMLSSILPGALGWIFFRLRGKANKAIALAALFLLVNAWFGFVLENRATMSITQALEEKGFDFRSSEKVHHAGLNMFEELCWINSLMDTGEFQPNWGERYLAEVVSPVPRSLWPEKPLVGIDYAIARGFSYAQGDGGVAASLSTGMIGQGVVNFGLILGPISAALLMAIWTTILARLDLAQQVELNGLGLVLTFNLGRDITLLTLYTFVLGAFVLWLLKRFSRSTSRTNPSRSSATAQIQFNSEHQRIY